MKFELEAFPTEETIGKIYDEMDLQRATQAYMDFFPTLSVYGIVKSHIRDFGFKTSSDIYETSMIGNLVIGCVTMAFCLTTQCLVVGVLLRALSALARRRTSRPTIIWSASVLIGVMLILLGGNLLQVALWAGLFYAYGEFERFSTAFYHSVVNFTTLGYGDVVMSNERRLLGALEAGNGVVMFGLTTSVLYWVLDTMMQQRRGGQAERAT